MSSGEKLGELPLQLAGRAPEVLEGYGELMGRRAECSRDCVDVLSRIDVLLGYASEVLGVGEEGPEVDYEVVVAVVNAAYWQQEVSLEMLERAYGSAMADSAWGTSGNYLKKGVGLLQFVETQYMRAFPAEASQGLFRITGALRLELQFWQQIGVVVLSLSKLRSKVYKSRRDAVLDFQDQDVAELGQNSLLYAKLVLGCLETATRCSGSAAINRPVVDYLNSLSFLLLSLDQYSKDQSGIALGMIEHAVKYLSRLVPQARLSESILAKKKKTDFFKNALHRKKKDSGAAKKTLHWIRKSKREELVPVLALTLDDFVIPLSQLLRYRYKQTNEKLAYQKVETDELALRKLFPRGKAPELKGTQWFFNEETSKLQEVVETTPTAGYY